MNRPLPPGDCGHRSRNSRWQSGFARFVPGPVGLVVGITTAAGTSEERALALTKHADGFGRSEDHCFMSPTEAA
jgi:hypothetical protein